MKAILRSGFLALAIMALAVPATYANERFGPFIYDPQSPNDLKLDGPIEPRSALNFRRAFDAHPEIERLYLDSWGGAVQTALIVADDVHRAGISTFIESNSECYSACSFIFFAGKIRQVDGRLGVHQVSAANERVDSKDLQINLSDIVEALNKYGVDPKVLEYMLRTSAGEMHIFTQQEIAQLSLNRTSQIEARNIPNETSATKTAPKVEDESGHNTTIIRESDEPQFYPRIEEKVEPVPAIALTDGLIRTTIPSASSNNTAKLWREVMAYFYGPYDRSKKCWIGKGDVGGGPAKFCMRPHKLEITNDGVGRKLHLVTGGYQINQDGGRDDCHACSGNIGIIVLSDTRETLLVAAKNSLYEPYGSWGSVPPEENFTFQKLGPQDKFGWLVRNGWTGQGVTINWASLYGVFDDTIREIGTVPLGYDERGRCSDGKDLVSSKPCTEYSYEFLFDTTDQSSPFYPIVLKLTGTREGERLNQKFRVAFDRKTLSYQLPEDMPDNR